MDRSKEERLVEVFPGRQVRSTPGKSNYRQQAFYRICERRRRRIYWALLGQMHRRALLTLAAVPVLFMCGSVLAQDKPLRVEILTTAPQQRDPILVQVTNLTTKTIQLALPLYFYGRQSLVSQTLASDPLDIEQT